MWNVLIGTLRREFGSNAHLGEAHPRQILTAYGATPGIIESEV
jgi:hypothetical protein